MAKRRMGIIAAALWVLLCQTSLGAQAASTADAKEPILPDTPCTLTLHYGYEDVVFPGLDVKLYKIADVSADFHYTLTADFTASGLILNGVQSQGEWDVIRTTLETYILANSVSQTHVAATDGAGTVRFEGLTPGLYMVGDQRATQDAICREFYSALIALPGLDEDGLWLYRVDAVPKSGGSTIEPDEDIQLKVLKLWRGDEDQNIRPQSVAVEIFRDGISYANITLSEENQWSYSWTAKNDGAKWVVAERNVPTGYTATVEWRDNSFVLVNSYGTDDPTPDEPPKTGDTSHVLAYMVPLYVSGIALIILGVKGKRKHT